jgi:tRNA C32,U32 (ribose-2'-O)-methylase TrmJ
LVKKNCDILTKIKIDEDVESLNVSNATAIALYELSLNPSLESPGGAALNPSQQNHGLAQDRGNSNDGFGLKNK